MNSMNLEFSLKMSKIISKQNFKYCVRMFFPYKKLNCHFFSSLCTINKNQPEFKIWKRQFPHMC